MNTAQSGTPMDIARQGDTVQVRYTGRLEDGTVFDSSEDRAPLEFTLGVDRLIPSLENAIEGLTVGERASTRIAPEDAFGPRSDDLVQSVPRDRLPEGVEPVVGMHFEMTTPEGFRVPVRVTAASGPEIEIDANHPLAGEVLLFEIELLKIL